MIRYQLCERHFRAFWDSPFQVHGSEYLGVAPMRADLGLMLDGTKNPVLDGPDRITYFAADGGVT